VGDGDVPGRVVAVATKITNGDAERLLEACQRAGVTRSTYLYRALRERLDADAAQAVAVDLAHEEQRQRPVASDDLEGLLHDLRPLLHRLDGLFDSDRGSKG
jgi:hypothetical protein